MTGKAVADGLGVRLKSTGGIRNFSPLAFVEQLMQLKLDQDGYKDVTVRARPIEPEKRAAPAKREA